MMIPLLLVVLCSSFVFVRTSQGESLIKHIPYTYCSDLSLCRFDDDSECLLSKDDARRLLSRKCGCN